MKVNGIAFKRAREEIKKNTSQIGKRLRGCAAPGTQEWLASKAKIKNKNGKLTSVSVRTIQYLEKGEASIQVIDAVSPFLRINGRELIFDYGLDSIELSAPSCIDFRPVTYPENSNAFHKSPLLISIDPLLIHLVSDDYDSVTVDSMFVNLKINSLSIDFKWLYEVELTPNGIGWLGIKREVFPITINESEPYSSSIMFSQIEISKLSWKDFIDLIKVSDDKLAQLSLTINFSTFQKILKIGVSISQINSIISCLKKDRYPNYLQPDSLTWRK